MAGFTNRGKYLMLGYVFRGTTLPTNFYVALVTSAVAPAQDHNTLSQLTEIAAGNGYTTGGYQLTPGTTDFDVQTENDTSDLALVQIKDVIWTASGGSIPSSGGGARYAVLTDNNVTVGSRQIIAYWSLGSDRTVSSGQTLTLQNCELDLTEV
ncbi:MAG: hypothetical protein AUK23_10130 [Deltaproteobacteria bacterium CG2_30_43_15]|nr:MAG: hypothetical protein AUK23_10130 [Deltaproteobacteria bacterium CG2_30_43_15]